MQLILFHPGVASFTCEDCRKYIYDMDSGKPKTYKAGPKREEKPMLRPANTKTPCEKCPRKSPEEAHHYELSDRNSKTWLLYRRAHATQFHFLHDAEKKDPLLARNFAILDELYAEHDRQERAATLTQQLTPFLVTRNG
jgi:hypothetical protein